MLPLHGQDTAAVKL